MLLAGVFGKRNLKAIDIKITFPEEIYANRENFIKLKIVNHKKFFPGFLIRVSIKELNLSYLFPYFEKEKEAVVSIKPTRRGNFSLKEIYISSVFPFNFFVRWRKISNTFSFLVFPEPKRCKIVSITSNKIKGDKYSETFGFEGDLISIKDYEEGMPVKYIHWKASAKTEKLKVKQFSDLTSPPLIIHLEQIPIPDREEKISCATYLIVESFKKGIPVGLKIGKEFFKPSLLYKHKINLLTKLALYE